MRGDGAPRRRRDRAEDGVALVVVVIASSVFLTLSLMLALTTTIETDVAGHMHEGAQALALADAGVARAVTSLTGAVIWDAVLSGVVTSDFYDGDSGARFVAGETVHLHEETARVTCGRPDCRGEPPEAVTTERPWGGNNPRWRVFASGTAEELLGDQPGLLPGYVVVWVGDDPAENDGDALHDGGSPEVTARTAVNPGAGVLRLKAVVWGPRGSRREVDATVERPPSSVGGDLVVRLWREVRTSDP